MLAAIKGADGAAATPSYSFASDLNTGIYRKAADSIGMATAGVERAYIDSAGKLFALGAADVAGVLTVAGVTADAFPSGTKMLFQQTAAPTGWTKDVTHNDKALRVVSGAAGSGGSVAFTTAFASQTPTGTNGGTALSVANLPAHDHFVVNTDVMSGVGGITASNYVAQEGGTGLGSNTTRYNLAGSSTVANEGLSSQTGSGTTHTHSFTGNAINLAVSYVDLIIATKN